MSTVVIAIGGTDYTADVVFETAHFESQVNGIAGKASLRIRDEDRTKSFTVGQTLTLQVDGDMVWRGFVATVNRTYVFPALNVDDFGLARFIDITGMDINILFAKRFVFNQSNPANVLAPLLPEHYPDDDAIATLIADWIDLSGDGLDTSTLVENVGDTTWTQEGRAWSGSDSFGQAMSSIANIPAAIYYIDPDLNLVYTDVDTPNAPFGLSDQYDGVTTFGYREMEVLMDGSGLANDVMCWGIGYGSQTPVFVRNEDAASQATHGLWQFAQTNFGIYKQATINRIAESIIDGSPQSKRGAKDDKVSVQCVTYQPGLRVAQKVDFSSEVFGFNDVIPIRKMEIDFPGPETPKYSLTLSHEIDTPFNFFDNFMWDFNLPPLPNLNIPPIGIPLPGPISCPTGCLLASCAYDDFDRIVAAPGWGGMWATTSSSAAGGGLTGGVPNMADVALDTVTRSTTITYNEAGTRMLDLAECSATAGPWDYYVAFSANAAFDSFEVTSTEGSPPPGSVFFPSALHEFDPGILTTVPQQFLQFWFETGLRDDDPSNPSLLRIAMDATSGAAWTLGSIGLSTSFPTPTPFTFVTGNVFAVHVQLSADGSTRANLWNATAGSEPAGWAMTRTATSGTEAQNRPIALGTAWVRGLQAGSLATDPDDNTFDFPAVRVDLQCGDFVSVCPIEDNFERTVPSGWGESDAGIFWEDFAGGANLDVAGGEGHAYVDSNVGNDLPFTAITIDHRIVVRVENSIDPTNDVFYFVVSGDFYAEVDVRTNGQVELYSSGETVIGPVVDIGSPIAFNVRLVITSETTFDAYVWAVGDPEPGSPTATLTDPTSLFLSTRYGVLVGGYSIGTFDLYVDNLNLICATDQCFPNGPAPLQKPALNAYVCENQITHGSDTIVTAHPFLPNSTMVWVNGILQAQTAYIENPAGASILLGFTPEPGGRVRVCYFSLP